VKIVHSSSDMRRKVGACKVRSLHAIKRYELKSNWKSFFQCKLFSKYRFDRVVEIYTASLKLGAQRIVDSAR